MKINKSAPAVSNHEILINAPTQKIWSLLSEISRWPGWNPAIQSANLNGPFKVGTTFDWKCRGISIISTLEEIQHLTKIVWSGKTFGTRAIHDWTLKSTPSGVLVCSSESIDGWLANLLRKSVQKSLDESLLAWLKELKYRAES